jgi:pyruvate dehydrogenase E1 component alpha subunit
MSEVSYDDPDELPDLYRSMLRIRLIEEEIARRYAEQEMRCPVHLSIGQEAAAVGACAALAPGDQLVTTHRAHSHYLAKGGDLEAMLAELYGKAAGCCGGRGGSMHLFDADAGVLVALPIVGSSIGIGVGAALAIKQRGGSEVCLVCLGDAALEEGIFHESANFAALKALPAIFFVENNLFSVYTRLDDRQPDRPLTDLAAAHRIPACRVNGNDVLAVRAATAAAVTRARRGHGPSFIVADTYRWREHCGPNYDNDLGYRPDLEFEAWKARCPVARFAKQLNILGRLGAAERAGLEAEIRAEIDAAFGFARAAPFPAGTTAAEGVYA